MEDYMRALQQRFFTEPRCGKLRQVAEQCHQELWEKLDKQDRRRLLQLADLEEELQDEISLASFTAGFRLAWGIMNELQEAGCYSFDQEEEQKACQLARGKENGYEQA